MGIEEGAADDGILVLMVGESRKGFLGIVVGLPATPAVCSVSKLSTSFPPATAANASCTAFRVTSVVTRMIASRSVVVVDDVGSYD